VTSKPLRHHDLKAWQLAIGLVKETYVLTSTFPKDEVYTLTSQMRRAATSVPSNIAEGAARLGAKEFVHFLAISRGSLSELETHLHIARELGYVSGSTGLDAVIAELFRVIGGLMESLRSKER
jgi:four helix bundle protein